ncbi:MAG: hypothetical protein GY861_24290 [bacterium]|nr:hypothetical protein [bacterium]
MIDAREIEEWLEAEAKLKEAKAEEIRLRNKICSFILQDTLKGSVKMKLFAWNLTATAKVNKTLDAELLQAITPDLTQEERDAIKWSPKIVAKAFKLLGEDTKLNEVITEKPGTPSLKAVPLKK